MLADGPELSADGASAEAWARAFQQLVSHDARGVFGQYLTPEPVAAHVAALVEADPARGPVLDPFAGSGILLDAVARRAPGTRLLGWEINGDVARVGRAALATRDADVHVGDAFAAWVAGDLPPVPVVVANPPYGAHATTLDRAALARTATARALGDPARLPVELLAVELCLDVLEPGGRLGIVLPRSVLTNNRWAPWRTAVLGGVRLRHATLLPEVTFMPFRGVAQACVLLVEKTEPVAGRRLTWAVSRGVGYDGAGRDHGTNDLPALAAAHAADRGPHAVLTPEGHVRVEAATGSVPTVRLGDVAEVSRGKTPPRDGFADTGAYLLKVAALSDTFLDWRDRERGRVPAAWFDRFPRTHLRVGDVCFTGTAHRPSHIGRKVSMVDDLPPEGALASAEVIRVRLRDDAPFPPAALLWWLRGPEGYAALQTMVRGATAHVYPRDLAEMVVPDLGRLLDVDELVRRHAAAHAAYREYRDLEDRARRAAGLG